MIEPKELERYQQALTLEQERLSKEVNQEEKPENFGGDVEGEVMEEKADEGEDMANRLAIAQTLKERLMEVEDALGRIQNGTYGTCVQCGAAISKEVLDVAPESALCADCKKGL